MRVANCHPELKHMARNMCKPCYDKYRYSVATDRHKAVNRANYLKNRVERCRKQKEWRLANLDSARAKSRERRRAFRRANPGYYRRDWLKRKYGLSIADYEAILKAQDGVCAVCRRADFHNETPHVDHDHGKKGRGSVRGILCSHCNKLLGHAYESLETLMSAAGYLERHRRLSNAYVKV